MTKEEGKCDDQPRKRLKISRACDCCRRKKVRCDAEYSTSLMKVVKICTNCIKNNDECTFSRIPLKRGPSKNQDPENNPSININNNNNNINNKNNNNNDNNPGDNKSNPPIDHPPTIKSDVGGGTNIGASGATGTSVSTIGGVANSNTISHVISNVSGANVGHLNSPTYINSSNPTGFASGSYTNSSNLDASPQNSFPPMTNSSIQVHHPQIINSNRGKSPLNLLITSNNSNSSINTITNSGTPTNTNTITLPFPYKSPSLSSKSISTQTNSIPSIKLPPIVYPKVLPHQKFHQKLGDSSPSSPSSNLDSKSTKSPPFWKVPYEMPSNQNIMLDSNINDHKRRSSSIDSMLSQSTNGSRFPGLISAILANLDALSDSDDDFYSLHSKRSRSNSHTSIKQRSQSPRNSISSLSSLNGRMSKNLYIGNNIIPSISLKSNLEHNLSIYYTNFHPNFPILPFNKNSILSIIDDNPNNAKLIDLFNQALYHIINFKHKSLNDHIVIIQKITSLYPFSFSNIQINDSVLILFFSSLILINYSIFLNGDIYNLNIALTCSIFNQFKILENFIDLLKRKQEHDQQLDYDNIKIYLPKLYCCLIIIDNLSSLSYGIQTSLPSMNSSLVDILIKNLNIIIPVNSHNSLNLDIFNFSQNFNELIRFRNEHLIGIDVKTPQIFNSSYFQSSNVNYQHEFNKYFFQLIQEKLDLAEFVYEISLVIKSSNMKHDLDDIYETIMDNNIKLIRMLKNITNLIINFANFISNSNTNMNNNNSNNSQLINPYLNLSISQLFKLIKFIKLIIDNLITLLNQIENSHNQELLNRCSKINKDLSISYNLLNLNLINLQLGSFSLNLIKNKIQIYNFNFDISNISISKNNLNSSLSTWSFEFLNTIVPFIERENVDGWY